MAPVIRVCSNYSEKLKTIKRGKMVAIGEPFLVFKGGHQMVMTLCPSGYNDGESTNLSVHLQLMKGPHDDELEQAGR